MTRPHDDAHPPPPPPSPFRARALAIADLLVDCGVLTRERIDRQIAEIRARTPANGARMVARAWVDPAYRELLLSDAHAAAAEFGIDTSSINEFVALENTATEHHLVVCTLCSCYPRAILGQPPDWYKSDTYRARAVREPRAVLAEFGVHLPPEVTVTVVDSGADRRFLVVPRRPEGTQGWSEAQLAAVVTRDSMIGTDIPRPVAPTAA